MPRLSSRRVEEYAQNLNNAGTLWMPMDALARPSKLAVYSAFARVFVTMARPKGPV